MFAEKFRQLTHKRPLILGHRGSPRLARENSLASFNLALEEGADGIELDVHVTADGVLVAHHDEYLETHEIIAQTNYADLKRAQQAVGSDLPTLAEVFRLVAGRGVLNIELKNPGYEPAAIALARELLPVDTFAFSSFDPRAVLACRHSAPDVPAFWIVWGPRNAGDDVKILEGLDASGIALENRFVTERDGRTLSRAAHPGVRVDGKRSRRGRALRPSRGHRPDHRSPPRTRGRPGIVLSSPQPHDKGTELSVPFAIILPPRVVPSPRTSPFIPPR